MKRKFSTISVMLTACSLIALSGCGGSDGINLSPCFPFVCQPTPAAPSVSTDPASNVTADSADLNGHVNPNWKDTGTWFEWGTSSTLSSYNQTPSQFISSGDSTITTSYLLSGLTGSTTYYYRAVAYNILGTSKGNIVSFTTP